MAVRIFTNSFILKLAKRLRSGDNDLLRSITEKEFSFSESDSLVIDSYPELDALRLDSPSTSRGSDSNQLRNAIKLFETLRITPYQASDPRLWSFLALVTFREYMDQKRPIRGQKNPFSYTLSHYLCTSSSVRSLLMHDIALLWWIPYLTIKPDGPSCYSLTEEVFSMLDYTRHLLQGTQGRAASVRHAVLEFVVENPELFRDSKESRIRLLMRRLNMDAGYLLFPCLDKDAIKSVIEEMRVEISECHG